MRNVFLLYMLVLFFLSSCNMLTITKQLENFEKEYKFDFSKKELKNKIIESYTYA